ncbi:MAG: hypothetical protein ACTSX9_05380 [Candidatus Njordarchaeales archaeon]
MPRKCGSAKKELDEADIKILKALAELGKPVGCKEIAEHIGESVRHVMGKLRGLKTVD